MSIYFDNATTSFPKPEQVPAAICGYLNAYGVSPGRSGHSLSVRVAKEIFETRELVASLFHAPDAERVVFTPNATFGLNTAIKGLLHRGNHVIISALEHNSVYRPIRHMAHAGTVKLSVAACDQEGYVDLDHLGTLFRPNTQMVVINHGSNVLGSIQPIREIGALCRDRGVSLVVDAAQTAGLIPIDMQLDNIDILVFSGHKKLYGPAGIGGMVLKDDLQIDALMQGGTGSRSESDKHPGFYPDRLEAGTPNTPGIVGLKAGIDWINYQGMDAIHNHVMQLTGKLLEGLQSLRGISIHGPKSLYNRLPLVSITIEGKDPAEVAYHLDCDHGIMTRPGLQCAPLAHKTAGTFPQGTLRFSLGAFNTMQDVERVVEAMKNEK
jgi:cysteine desulfurase / selenocysteine lyase